MSDDDEVNDRLCSQAINSLEFRDDKRHRLTATGLAVKALFAAGWPLTATALLDVWILECHEWHARQKKQEATP